MELRTNTAPVAIRAPPLMICAQCGQSIHMKEWSEHVDERRVRHLWECDSCGYQFETLACFPLD